MQIQTIHINQIEISNFALHSNSKQSILNNNFSHPKITSNQLMQKKRGLII
jgi:hypothetical protein